MFAVMPNHLHGLITINPPAGDTVGAHRCVPSSATTNAPSNQPTFATTGRAHGGALVRRARLLSSNIAQFKASSTVAVSEARGMRGAKIWQRGFHEHVVRNDKDFDRIAWYIVTNPDRWETDDENQRL